MSSYIGRHAELYDIFYANKPYEAEAAFVDQCLQKYSIGKTRRLLELACGTGRHALALEKLGYKIVAVDYSVDMLACARRKITQVSSQVDFRWQDMRALNLPDDPFDAVICLFDSMGYVATNEALKQVLEGVYNHLRPNGLFVFEFWHAAAMLRSYDPVRIRRWSIPGGELLRISETNLKYPQQLSQVTYTVYELRDNGTYSSFKETQINRYFLVQEMAYWLSSSGFTPLKWFAGFTPDEQITEQTWHVVAVARKTPNSLNEIKEFEVS
ncbi:MAG TPA: class I SAM-dependent methyltransferase [Candidatus Limnocylindrales bacterium]|nr:class I SAM-dependent methyltransferase [Candidatus Limnocylindrales bacterium]